VLLEMAAANVAFKTVQQLILNGKTLYQCGSSLTDYFSASSEINKKQASSTGSGSALESYQAQQELKRQREALKWAMNKAALMGWSDYLAFEAEWHREQKEIAKATAHKRYLRNEAIQENVSIGLKACGIILAIMAALFGVALYVR